MLLVALAAVVLNFLTVSAGAALLRHQQRAHSRERDGLLDRLMHLADKTWTPPPADKPAPQKRDDERRYYTASPENLSLN